MYIYVCAYKYLRICIYYLYNSSPSQQSSMDLHEFLFLLDTVGALKAGELRRAGSCANKSVANTIAPSSLTLEAHVRNKNPNPALEKLDRSMLSKNLATLCFHTAAKTREGRAGGGVGGGFSLKSGELDFELYVIACKHVAILYAQSQKTPA